jgi:hypothetical protein
VLILCWTTPSPARVCAASYRMPRSGSCCDSESIVADAHSRWWASCMSGSCRPLTHLSLATLWGCSAATSSKVVSNLISRCRNVELQASNKPGSSEMACRYCVSTLHTSSSVNLPSGALGPSSRPSAKLSASRHCLATCGGTCTGTVLVRHAAGCPSVCAACCWPVLAHPDNPDLASCLCSIYKHWINLGFCHIVKSSS